MPPRATDGPPGRRRVALGYRLANHFLINPTLDPATRTIAENSNVGTVVVGGAIVGSDVDAGQTLSYSLVAPRKQGLAHRRDQ